MTPRRPPATDAAALERAALAYLERFDASTESLKRVLKRRLARAARLGASPDPAAAATIEALIARFIRAGYLNDQRYATATGTRLAARGRSRQRAAQTLAAKGVANADIDAALAPYDDRAAALALARRRGLGPFRRQPLDDRRRNRELAILARGGFGAAVALAVVDAENEIQLIDRLSGG